jgi:thiamine biosynthesis protein ThiI
MAGLVLVRYGEIALKGRNRPLFIGQLRANLQEALDRAGLQGQVRVVGRRLHIEVEDAQAAAAAAARVFGVTSVSPVRVVGPTMEAIEAGALLEAKEAGLAQGRSFRVQARRADKGFPLTSPEINRRVGELLARETGARVDLSDRADCTVGIEVQRGQVLIYSQVLPGPGGLPTPLSGKVVALVSGGLDSPVAAWLMMKRGCGVVPLHLCDTEAQAERFRALCAVLAEWSFGWKVEPIVRSHREAIAQEVTLLRRLKEERWTCLFCKRAMLLEAEKLALEVGAQGIVLGDSLGQVASQTLENMRVISSATCLPIYRPLIAMDKVEVVAVARRIGTYEISAKAQPPCPYLPASPVTQASYRKFERLLARLEQLRSADTDSGLAGAHCPDVPDGWSTG